MKPLRGLLFWYRQHRRLAAAPDMKITHSILSILQVSAFLTAHHPRSVLT